MTFAQALRNIRETPPRLEDSIVTQVWGRSDYDEHHLDPIELASRVQGNVGWLLDALVDVDEHGMRREPARIPGYDVVRGVAVEIGERRAIQGVGIDAVIGSWRTAERIIQERVVALAGEVAVDELLDAVRMLGVLIGALTDASVEGYRRVQSEVTEHYDRLTSDFVTRIVSRSGLTADEVEERARVVEADPRALYAAVALGTASAEASAALHAQRHLLGHLAHRVGGRILVGRTAVASGAERPLLLVPVRADTTDALVAQVREGARRADAGLDIIAGVSSTTATLVEAHGPARQARLALEVVTGAAHGSAGESARRIETFADVAVEALLLGDPETAALLAQRVQPLAAKPELLATLRAWFDAGRSARGAARALYVHANTVPHRLATAARLLGRDLAGEPDLLDLELALRAHELAAATTSRRPSPDR